MGKLLTPEELGALLKLKPEALKSMRRRDQGPPWIKLSAHAIRYDWDEVQRWLAERTIGSKGGQKA